MMFERTAPSPQSAPSYDESSFRKPIRKESKGLRKKMGKTAAKEWEKNYETPGEAQKRRKKERDLTEEQKRTETAKRLQSDPVFACENALGAKTLWERQKEIIKSVHENRRTAVRSAHGCGKSYTAARVAVAFLLTHPDSIVATTAPTDRQVKKILWQEIRRTRAQMTVPCRTMPLVKEWTIRDGWFAIGLSTDDPDAFQGLHSASGYVLIVIDEASGVPKPIWDAIDGSLSSEYGRLLVIGNPTNPIGPFHDEFLHPHTNKIAISAFDTPNFTTFGITIDDIRNNTWKEKITGPLPYPSLVTPMWVREKFETWGENSPLWIARVMGNFPEEAEDTLIPIAWVEAATNRYAQWNEEEDPAKKGMVPLTPVELGVDIARYGRNETVISLRRGAVLKKYKSWQGKNLMETVGRIVQAKRDTGATIIKVDDGGLGGGVVDRLEELKEPVEAVNGGSKPIDPEHFLNRRAEMWWNGRELLRKGEVLLEPDDTMEGQLSAPKYSYDSHAKIKVEGKEDLEDRGVSSPDRADSILLAMLPSRKRKGPIAW